MFEVPIPPVLPVLGEYPATIEPPLLELPEFRGVEVGRPEPVDLDQVDESQWAELDREAREVALADERVRDVLADRRYSVIGVGRLDRKQSREERVVLVAYCYDDGLAYEVLLSRESDGLTVRDVSSADYQPAPSDEEVEQAIKLASSHRLVADRLQPDFEAHALLTSGVEPGDEHYGRRRFSVVFGPSDERLPRVHSVVDLGSEELVWVHTNRGTQR